MSRDIRFMYRSEVIATVSMLILLAVLVQIAGHVIPNSASAPPGTQTWLTSKLAVGTYLIVMGVVVISARALVARSAPSIVRFASHPGWLFVTAGIGLDVMLLALTRYQVSAVLISSLILLICVFLQVLLYVLSHRLRLD